MVNEQQQQSEQEKPLVVQYVEAEQRYHDLLDQVIPVRNVVPGQPIEVGTRPFNPESIAELQALEDEVNRLREAWMNENQHRQR